MAHHYEFSLKGPVYVEITAEASSFDVDVGRQEDIFRFMDGLELTLKLPRASGDGLKITVAIREERRTRDGND